MNDIILIQKLFRDTANQNFINIDSIIRLIKSVYVSRSEGLYHFDRARKKSFWGGEMNMLGKRPHTVSPIEHRMTITPLEKLKFLRKIQRTCTKHI